MHGDTQASSNRIPVLPSHDSGLIFMHNVYQVYRLISCSFFYVVQNLFIKVCFLFGLSFDPVNAPTLNFWDQPQSSLSSNVKSPSRNLLWQFLQLARVTASWQIVTSLFSWNSKGVQCRMRSLSEAIMHTSSFEGYVNRFINYSTVFWRHRCQDLKVTKESHILI